MTDLSYLVIEYVPHKMDAHKLTPARIDGHYQNKEMAIEVAELLAAEPFHEETRIVVVRVQAVLKQPAHWQKRNEQKGLVE